MAWLVAACSGGDVELAPQAEQDSHPPAVAPEAPETEGEGVTTQEREAGTAGREVGSGSAGSARFLDEPDAPRRRALLEQPFSSVEKGRGGRSLAFKITLADGTRGYYKPEQSFSGSHWYAELASYYLDRLLGLGRVAPSIGRRVAWDQLSEAAGGDRRVAELTIREDGTVRGAFIWWIPEDLPPLVLGSGWERWIRQGGGLSVTPYVRPRDYAAQVQSWKAGETAPGCEETLAPSAPEAPATAERAAELSDLVLFDYLTTNVDRWGGMYTNVRSRGADGPLIFLDNGAGFSPGRARIGLMEARLKGAQRFRRSTVEAIRRITRDDLVEAMARDPLAPLLEERQLAGFEERRQALLEHVGSMVRAHGDAALPW